jgi:hypothetical protein
MQLGGGLDESRPAGTFASAAGEPAVGVTGVEQRAPRLDLTVFGHGLR